MSEKKCSSLALMIVRAGRNSWSELLTSVLSSGLNRGVYTVSGEEFSQNVSNPVQLDTAWPV
jgi:hypothetical protein